MREYFSSSYLESRQSFLELAESIKGVRLESVCLRDDLFIDFAYKSSKSHKKILFLVSGTHGVEGYIGSAVQRLFIKEFLSELKGVSVCFVHSLNPFGFKFDRRVNENNVDINRNSVFDERLMLGIRNTSVSNFVADSLLFLKLNRPRKHRLFELFNYYYLVSNNVFKKGLKKTIRLGVEGQFEHPSGVGFCGAKLEDSLLVLRSFIEQKTQGFDEAVFVDIHTGAGKKYDFLGFTSQRPDSQGFRFLKKILKKVKSRFKTSKGFHSGSVSDLFLSRSHASRNVDLTLEFGTVPKISSALALDYLAKLNIAENQVFFFGDEKKRLKTRLRYRKAYSPMDKVFRNFVCRKSRKFFSKLVSELNL